MTTVFKPFCDFSELPNLAYFSYHGERYEKSGLAEGITLDGVPTIRVFSGDTIVLPFETDDYEVYVPPEPNY